ncbi:MAG: hypothetical protein ACLQED_09255 [Desulfobaccales bacterium]
MIYLLCYMAGGLTGFVLAAMLGANADADYRDFLRRQIEQEILERDYGTLDSPLTFTENGKRKTGNAPL